MREDYTTLTVSKDTYEELLRRKTSPKESMESIIKRLINKDTPGYKSEIDIQNKNSLLKKVRKTVGSVGITLNNLSNEIGDVLNEWNKIRISYLSI